MSSLVVDTNVLARAALGELETADEIAPALERLRHDATPSSPDHASVAMRMVGTRLSNVA